MIRLSTVLAIAFGGLAGTVGASLAAYSAATDAGRKGDAEIFLFAGLVVSLCLVLGLVLALLGASRRRMEIEAIADATKHGGSISDARLERLGPIGRQIRSILSGLADASDRKSARIASLTGLLRAALAESEKAMLAIGLDGRIIAASSPLASSKAFAGLRVSEATLGEYFPELDLRAVLEESSRTHRAVERAGGLSFIPVYSLKGEIGHFLVLIGHKSILESLERMVQGARDLRRNEPEAGASRRPGPLAALRGALKRKPPREDGKTSGRKPR